MKAMKKILVFLIVIGFVSAALSETAEEKGYRLSKMNDDQPKFQKNKGEATLKIYSSTGELRFQKKLVMATFVENMGTLNEKENYTSAFLEPADDAGNSYMMYNYKDQADVKYIYLKGIRKAKKVTGVDKKLSFFGSDFYNGDVGKPDITESNYKYLGDESMEFKGKKFDCYVIEATPKTDAIKNETGYGRMVSYLEKKTLLTLRLDYFDENKIKIKELRLLTFISRNNVKGQKVYYPSGLEMRNVKKGTRTELLFKNMRFEEEANINLDIFSVEYMTRKWW